MDAIDQGKEYIEREIDHGKECIEHEGTSRYFAGPGNISQFSHLDGKKATGESQDNCQ